MQVDLQQYQNFFSRRNQFLRLIWQISWFLLARPFPRSLGNSWKLFLLRIFGAKIHPTAVVYSTARIYMPWKLHMQEYSCIAPHVNCYNVDDIFIGSHSTISQYSFLCTASHDISDSRNRLIHQPIIIENQAWLGACCFIGMGVTIGEGSVVGAKSYVYKNIAAWTVVSGNPAKFLKKRKLVK